MGVNATGTLVAGRAPKTRESRHRKGEGGGVWEGVPRKFMNFHENDSDLWYSEVPLKGKK